MTALLAVLALTTAPAHALRSDREQPIRISANTVDVNQEQGVNRYQGNVKLTQGTLRIQAEEVVVHYRDGVVDQVSAVGKPVTFRQRLDKENTDIEGSALRLQYNARDSKIDMFDQVAFRQGEDFFRSSILHYDLATSRLSAEGQTDEGRVFTILKPRKPPAPAPGRTDKK